MWYKVLKINENSSAEEIKLAYDKMMKNPNVANDMEKSFKVREAYKQGIAHANTYNSNPSVINENSVIKIKPKSNVGKIDVNSKPKRNMVLERIDSMSLYSKIKLIFLLTFIIGMILVAAGEIIQQALYDDVEDITYDNEILNCIATETEKDLQNFEELIYLNGYVLEYTYLDTKIFMKEEDNYKFFLEVDTYYGYSKCKIKLVEEVDLEWKEKPAKLIGEYTVTGNYNYGKELSSYKVEYNVYKEDPFYETDTVLYDSYDEIEDDIDEFDPTNHMQEEYMKYISNDIISEYFDILKSELESF